MNVFSNIENIGVLKVSRHLLDKALEYLRAIAGQEIGIYHGLGNLDYLAARKETSSSASSPALEFITEFATATNKELRRTMLLN